MTEPYFLTTILSLLGHPSLLHLPKGEGQMKGLVDLDLHLGGAPSLEIDPGALLMELYTRRQGIGTRGIGVGLPLVEGPNRDLEDSAEEGEPGIQGPLSIVGVKESSKGDDLPTTRHDHDRPVGIMIGVILRSLFLRTMVSPSLLEFASSPIRAKSAHTRSV